MCVNRPTDDSVYQTSYMSGFGDRVRDARKERGLSQAALAGKSGISQSVISDIERGEQGKSGYAAQIASTLEVSALWLASGRGPKNPASVTRLTHSSAGSGPLREIALMNAEPGMGTGRLVPDNEHVSAVVQVSDGWLQSQFGRAISKRIRCLQAYGDSMSDTFEDGDVLFVDPSVRDLTRDAIYVLRRTEELFVKRVHRDMVRGGWTIISDNTKYPPQHVDTTQGGLFEGLEVAGQVLGAWSWHRF